MEGKGENQVPQESPAAVSARKQLTSNLEAAQILGLDTKRISQALVINRLTDTLNGLQGLLTGQAMGISLTTEEQARKDFTESFNVYVSFGHLPPEIEQEVQILKQETVAAPLSTEEETSAAMDHFYARNRDIVTKAQEVPEIADSIKYYHEHQAELAEKRMELADARENTDAIS